MQITIKKIVLSVEEEKAKLSYPNIITPPPPHGCSSRITFLDSFYVIQQGPTAKPIRPRL